MNRRDKEQNEALNFIKLALINSLKALCVCATGYGKGHLIKLIAKTVKGRMLVVVPRVGLVEDIANRIGDCSIFCASLGKKEIGKITVCTKQSIEKHEIESDLVILDEVHNYKKEFLEKIKAKYIIGMTATPWGEKGLIYPDFFQKPCYEFDIEKSIEAGFLCDYKMFGAISEFDVSRFKKLKREYTKNEVNEVVEEAKHVEQVAEIISAANIYGRKKVAILCASIDHAEKIHNEIHGSVIVHSKLKCAKQEIERFRDDARFCVSVLMLSEGFDMPSIDMVVFLRPTKSSKLMVQAAGRGLRLHSNKEYCLLMDFGSVFKNCGTPKKPIIPAKVKGSSEILPTAKRCEACHCIFESGFKCPECGHITRTERDVEDSLHASALNETKTVAVYYSHIHNKGGGHQIKKAKNGAPYLCINVPSIGFVTIFGKAAYRLLNGLLDGPAEIHFVRYKKKNGDLGWKNNSFSFL